MKILWFSVCVLFSVSGFSETKVDVFLDRNVVPSGGEATLTVRVSSEKSVAVEAPDLSRIPSLQIGESWSTSQTQTSLTSGSGGIGMEMKSTHIEDYHFRVSPVGNEDVLFPSIEVVVDGKKYRTKPLNITVGESPPPTPHSQGGRQGLDEDPMDEAERLFQQLLRRQGVLPQPPGGGAGSGNGRGGVQPRSQPTSKENFFLQLDLDKNEVFEGEPIVANWFIYTRGNILDLSRVKFPDLTGFWKEIIEEVPSLQFESEIINGIPYRRALLASHALFPLKSGSLSIDEYRIKAVVQFPSGAFGGFGFGPTQSIESASERKIIKVLPLPLEGKTESFRGGVGQFEVSRIVDTQKIYYNQAFSVKIRFEGRGNAKQIEFPQLNWAPDFELFDIRSEAKFFKDGTSFKEFELILVPKPSDGKDTVTFPKLSFSFFDPKKKGYVTKELNSETWKVLPSTAAAGGGSQRMESIVAKENTSVKTQELQVITEKSKLPQDFWEWIAIGIVNLVGFSWLIIRAKPLFAKNKSENLTQLFRRRWSKVQSLRSSGNERKAAAEAIGLILQLLLLKTKGMDPNAEFTVLLGVLPNKLKKEISAPLTEVYSQLELIAFSPESVFAEAKSRIDFKRLYSSLDSMMKELVSERIDN
jgi:BatD DUF11 like domain